MKKYVVSGSRGRGGRENKVNLERPYYPLIFFIDAKGRNLAIKTLDKLLRDVCSLRRSH